MEERREAQSTVTHNLNGFYLLWVLMAHLSEQFLVPNRSEIVDGRKRDVNYELNIVKT